MRRRVLLLVSTLDGGGPGSVMVTLARSLEPLGLDPILVATHGPTDAPLIRRAADAGIRVEVLGMRSMWDPRGVRRFASLVRATRPDIVHTRTIRADLLGRVATALGVPVVNNTVNLYPEDCLVRLGPVVGRGVMALATATAGAARMFVANAEIVARNTVHAFRVDPRRVRVVLDGIDVAAWRGASPADLSAEGIAADDTVCLAVARLHPQKALEDLVDAAAEVARRRDVRFVIAGDGPSRSSLEERIRMRGLTGRVVLLGERRDVPQLVARADLFVLSSRFEGLPTAIIEAMAGGVPVVATTVGGNAEVVEEGQTGWLVPPGRPDLFGDAVTGALASDLDAFGARSVRRVEEHFSARSMARSFVEVYEDVIRGVPGQRHRQPVRAAA